MRYGWLLIVLVAISGNVSSALGGVRSQSHRRASSRSQRFVRGLDGQAHLLVDTGRRLDRFALAKSRDQRRGLMLEPIEKVRLDARRVWLASRLTTEEKLLRFVEIARNRIPDSIASEKRYQSVADHEIKNFGFVNLSTLVAKKAGGCRERAFLLYSMFSEVGIDARVRYGELYVANGDYLGGHAWVKVKLGRDQTTYLVDVSASEPIQRPTRVPVRQKLPDGSVRRVRGAETAGFLYVPTNDLRILRGNVPSL